MLASRHLIRRAVQQPVVVSGHATLSSYSSFFESNPSLFNAATQEKQIEGRKMVVPGDAELRDNVRTMGSLLGNIIQKRQGKDIFDKVEKLRHLAKVSWTRELRSRICLIDMCGVILFS